MYYRVFYSECCRVYACVSCDSVGRYYRMIIPREVRRLLSIGENDEVEWVFEDGKVVIKKESG